MDPVTFDALGTLAATSLSRRRVVAGIGALALGGAATAAMSRQAAADRRDRCHQRCNDHGSPNARNHKSRNRCHHRCENRH